MTRTGRPDGTITSADRGTEAALHRLGRTLAGLAAAMERGATERCGHFSAAAHCLLGGPCGNRDGAGGCRIAGRLPRLPQPGASP